MILTIGLVPILNLSTAASRTSVIIRDNLIAAGLAQEGVEVVRAIRDTNWFNSQPFDSGLGAGVYQAEWNSTALLTLNPTTVLNLNNGLYTYSGGTPSKFTRTITITKVNSAELKVESSVTWASATNPNESLVAEAHLFDWR